MSDWIGKEISQYRVVQKIGQGGMGDVYLAEDVNIGRKVVLKLLKSELASDTRMAERFHREARACAAVTHPNITTIFEVDRHENVWYICMEYVEGQTLRMLLRERKMLGLDEAIRIAARAADALGAAHKRNIVHRDMKPENIMLTASGHVKVLDFGLAAFTQTVPPDIASMKTGADRLTAHGIAIGTLHYMSPEQTRGDLVTPASDVFALGSVLYEMLAGTPPFAGRTSLAVMHAIAYDPAPSLAAHRTDVPQELEQVIRRALRKEPDRRYATGALMREDLMRLIPPETLPGRPTAASQASAPAAVSRTTGRQILDESARRFDAGLVGRDKELGVLLRQLDAAIEGNGSLVLVAGEAGVGKTRLVAELSRRAEEQGARCLQGRCLFREGALPYHPFVEAAEELVTSLGLNDAQAFDRYVHDRMPSLAGRLPILKSFLHVAGAESTVLISDKEHLLDAISALFLAFAREQPMVLLIDDLHWADEATLDLLLYLARNCRRSSGLIVGTLRPEEMSSTGGPDHPLGRLLDRASAGDLYLEVKLERLGPQETSRVISSALNDAALPPEFVTRLHHETAGNPFYVLETLKLLAEDGTLEQKEGAWKLVQSLERVTIPGRVHDVVTRRLARVGGADREVLEIAASEGMVFHSDTIATCLGIPRIRVLGALQRSEKEHHLIHSEREGYTFDHPLIREILYEAIIPELRREYHRLMGDYLSVNRRGRPGEEAAIAYQYLEASQEELALPFLLEAGRRARRLYANIEALSSLNRAETILLELRERAGPEASPSEETVSQAIRLYKERGRLHQRLGDHDRAMSDYLAMQRWATQVGHVERQAHALSLMANLYHAMGEYDQALDRARQSQDLASRAGDKRSLSSALSVIGAIHFYRAEYDEALEAHQRSIDLHNELEDMAGYAENLNKVGNIHLTRGDSQRAEAVYQEALALARRSRHRLAEAESLNNLGVLSYYGGDAATALGRFEECLALKREIGDKRSLARSLSNLGMVLEMRGDLENAVTTHQESLALMRSINDQGSTVIGLGNLTSAHCRAGRYAEALAAGKEALALSEAIGDRWVAPYALNSLGRIRLILNQPAEAEKLLERALKMSRDQKHRVEECQSLQGLGEAGAALGRVEEGLALLSQARLLAQELRARDRESETVYLSGLLLARRGETAPAADCARDLAELAGTLMSREAEVRRLHLEGSTALLDARRADASRCLGEGASLASRVGLRELEWRLRHDLARTLGDSAEGIAQIARAAALIEDLAGRTGSPELAASYLADPERREVIVWADRVAPRRNDSGSRITGSSSANRTY